MYSDVRSFNILRGPTAKVLPVTGAMLIGWNIVAAVYSSRWGWPSSACILAS